MLLRLYAATLVVLMPLGALAQPLPPVEGVPLSSLIASIEADDTLGPILEIEWEDDGYWEIELIRTSDGRKIEIHLDPYTGEQLRRRGD